MGVSDRVKIINLAGVPSVLFTAQFFPPSATVQRVIDAIWRQFIWDGTVSSSPRKAHKLDRRIIELPRDVGGMGLRDYRGATLAQAATALLRWNSRPHDKYWDAFRVANLPDGDFTDKARQTYPRYPARPPTQCWKRPSGMWTAAINSINRTLTRCYAFPSNLIAARQEMYARWSAPWQSIQWRSSTLGRLRVPENIYPLLVSVQQATYAAMPAEIRSYWATFPWHRNDWFRAADGSVLTPSSYPMIQATSVAALQLQHVEHGVYEFMSPGLDPFRTRRSSLARMGEWLQLVLGNMAALPGDLMTVGDRVYASGKHPVFDQYEWIWKGNDRIEGSRIDQKWSSFPARAQQATMGAIYTGWGSAVRFEAYSDDARTGSDLISLQGGSDVVLAGHPKIQHAPTLLPALPVYPGKRTALRVVTARLLRTFDRARLEGVQTLRARLATFRERTGAFGTALHTTTWTALTNGSPGLSDYQRFFWYRLALGAFNLRDNDGTALACPHSFCASPPPLTMEHVLWACPGAKLFWEELFRGWSACAWEPLSAEAGRQFSIFSRSPPRMKPPLLQLFQGHTTDYASIQLAAEHVWRVICTVACQHLWLQRNAAAFRAIQLPMTALARSIWKAVERQLEVLLAPPSRPTQSRLPFPAFRDLWAALTDPPGDTRPPTTTVRLYFDGGARGNPGVSGCGSLLLEQRDSEPHWRLVWWTASYLGNDKTNNYAEHAALAAGVRECAARYQPQQVHLHIIGDSRLVLHHVVGTAKVKTRSLRGTANHTACALGQFPYLTLSHTLRAGNTMADYLANHAMDTQHTTTSSTARTPIDERLEAQLPSDTVFTIAPITRQPSTDLLHDQSPATPRLQQQAPD